MKKYKDHFGEEPCMYNKINYDYERWLDIVAGKEKSQELFELERIDYGKFKWNIGEYSIRSMALNDGLEIADNYKETNNKKYYMAWDKRDRHMIRYLVNHGFYKARIIPICKHCGKPNSRSHVTNNCPKFDGLRESAWKELDELKITRLKMKVKFNEDLEKAFLDAYFKPGPKCVGELEVLKKFSLQ